MAPSEMHRVLEQVGQCKTGTLWALPAFAAVFVLIGSVESTDAHPNLAAARVFYVLAAVSVALFAMQRMQRHRSLAFLDWLWTHRDSVIRDENRFGDQVIRGSTALLQFEMVFSFLVFATRQRTTFLVAGTGPAIVARCGAILVTVLFGWWSSQGLLWSAGALARNLGRGSRTTPMDLLGKIEAGLASS